MWLSRTALKQSVKYKTKRSNNGTKTTKAIYGYTKVQLIEAGYEELLARHDTAFAKLKDGYDDFFGFEEIDKKKTE